MLQFCIIAAVIYLLIRICFGLPSVKVPVGAFRIVDGDGVNIEHNKIRIIGFDAPEWNQPGGSDATAALSALLSKGFTLKPSGERDHYGRILARLFVRRRRFGLPLRADVAILMLAAGHGHCDARGRQWLGAHGRAEITARLMRRGLWSKSGFLGLRALNPKYWRRQQQQRQVFAVAMTSSKGSAEPRRSPVPRFKPKRPLVPRDLR